MTATVTRAQRAYLWGLPLLLSAGCVATLWRLSTGQAIPKYFVPIAVLVTVLAWYACLHVPRHVSMKDGVLVFLTGTGVVSINVQDVERIDVRLWKSGYVDVIASRRRIGLLRNMPGLLPLLAQAARDNPMIAVRGSLPSRRP